jgi:peptidoglycan hydrolase-like protein with peptidoglycan-binding domain
VRERAQATAPEAAVSGRSLPRAPKTRGNIREAQRLLAEAGLYHGKMTGRMNRELAEALRRYQQQNGLTVTGTVDEATMARLTGRL